METRFSNEHYEIIAADYLIPNFLHKLSDGKIAMILPYYGKLMTTEKKAIFSIEVAKWKNIYLSIPVKQRLDTTVGLCQSAADSHFQH